VRHLPTQGAEAELLLVQKSGTESEGFGISGIIPSTDTLVAPLVEPLVDNLSNASGEGLSEVSAQTRNLTRNQPEQFFIAKIYRHGIALNREVQRRLGNIPDLHKVKVIETGVSDTHAYELTEFCQHGSLRQWMQANQGNVSTAQISLIVAELSQALSSVHAAGLLHRDLKPENILIRSLQPLDLILTDFGISSVLDATQKLTGMARTLSYAAPESISGVISAASDFWALGVIILEAALGFHPFKGLSEAVILHHLTTREFDLNTLPDQNLVKLLSGLFIRDPQKRWSHLDIQRWLAGDPSLPFPQNQHIATTFRQAYHLAQDVCHTNEQLAVALCRHWDDGIVDLTNGQLLHWFRDVQKDQNACRLILSKGQTRQDHWTPSVSHNQAQQISIDIVYCI